MRLIFLLLTTSIVLLSTFAYGQRVTLKKSNTELVTIFKEIRKQTGYDFLYSDRIMKDAKPVNLTLENASVEEALRKAFVGQPFVYTIEKKTILVKAIFGAQTEKTLVQHIITGRIVDEWGVSMPRASVSTKLSRTNTMANDKGIYSIAVTASGDSLFFSYVGYQRKAVLASEDLLIVTMEPMVDRMNNVVVTGMSRRNKESFTGGYITVKGEELKKFSPNNLLKAIQYFDPSFKVLDNINRGSDPNAELQFQLRGDAALGNTESPNNMDLLLDNVSSRPNVPLFVLDGFIVNINRITNLDPERVQTVTILKDAASTAIYGSRAANGVIVIETKVAPEGALSVSYATNMGIQMPDLSDYNLLDAAGKLALEWQSGVFETNNAQSMNSYNHYKREVLAGVNTYWLSQPLRTAIGQRHSLSLAGGTEAFRYGLGLNVAAQPGVMKGSSRDTKGVNFNMQYRKGNWNIGAAIDVTDIKGNNSPYGDFSTYTLINPYYRVKDENNSYLKVLDNKNGGLGIGAQLITNPLYNTKFNQKDFTKSLTLSNQLNIDYSPVTNLRFTTRMSYVRGMAKEEQFKPAQHTDFELITDLTKKGSYLKNTGENANWSVDIGSNYNLIRDKHMFSVFGNFTVMENSSNYVNLLATGFPNEHMDDFLFGTEMSERVRGSEATSRSLGLTGQFSYSYDYRYSADFNIRADASSQFGADRQVAPFWSAGFRWNAHQEKWLQDRVSNFVIRASYGKTGAQNYAPYQAIEFYSYLNLMFPYLSFDVLGAELKGLGNSELGWSKTDNASVSLDLGFWNNRLSFSGTYYNNITRQMLVDFSLAPSTGFDSRTFNAGELQNGGVDLSMSFIPVQHLEKRLQWTVSVNGNHNNNKIRKISNALKTMNQAQLATQGAPLPVYQEGYSTSAIYLVRSLGIDPVSGQEVYLTRDNKRTYIWNASDKLPVGDANPKVSGAITSSFAIGDMSLNLGMMYRFGGYTYNQTLVDKIENSNIIYNMDRRALYDRWTTPGQPSYYKKYDLMQTAATPSSTRFLMKLNEFRFNNIALSYRMRSENSSLLRRINAGAVNLTLGTEDLLRFASVRQERGLAYPFARTYNLSISVVFK